MQRHHPGYEDITINSNALEVVPENGNISSEIPVLESSEVAATLLSEEDGNQYLDDPAMVGIPDLQQNDLSIDQLRAEIRNQRNEKRRRQGFTELQAPSFRSTPLDEFDEALSLFSNDFPYLFPFGKAEFRTPRQRSIKLFDHLLHAVTYQDGRCIYFYFI